MLLVAPLARAQVRFGGGPQVGVTLSSTRFTQGSNYGNNSKALYRTGVQAGFASALEAGHFALQPALLYCQEGYTIRTEYTGVPANASIVDENVRLDYLKIPVNLAYAFRANGQGVRLLAGGYTSFLLGGKRVISSSSTREERDVVASDEYRGAGKYYSRSVDAGLQAGVGTRLKQIMLQADYSFGLRNTFVSSGTGSTTSMYNSSLHISAAYLFGIED